MKSLLPFFILAGFLTASGLAADFNLPPNLGLVSQDSVYVTVRDKGTGFMRQIAIHEPPATVPAWQVYTSSFHGVADSSGDTCFTFQGAGRILFMGHLLFGDANGNDRTEIAGLYGGNEYIYEYSGHDTTYDSLAMIPRGFAMDYGEDTDGDGKREMMCSRLEGMTLLEAPDSFSLPTDSVYIWPWNIGAPTIMFGGFTDLDGDGVTEISFRQSLMSIEDLRCIGDSQYELAYSIPSPESLLDNYYNYIWGDLDDDGRNEVLTTGSMGSVLEFENLAPDSFAFVWMAHVRHWNTNWIAGPTDLDQDGRQDFVVMAMSVSRGGYFFDWFESIGDNQFQMVYSDSLTGDVWGSSGSLRLFDIDNDGIDELVVCTGYWIGIYKAVADNRLAPIYLWEIGYWEAPVYDTNGNGYGELLVGHHVLEYTPGLDIFGDVNSDCQVDLLDLTYLVNYFKGYDYPLPRDIYLADVNGDCHVNGLDVSYFVNYFHNGPALIHEDCR